VEVGRCLGEGLHGTLQQISGCHRKTNLTVTRKSLLEKRIWGGNRIFAREMGTFGCWVRLPDAVEMPNSCPTSHCVQTPVTLRQEKVSPSAKILNVYGTSMNIG